MMGPNDARGVNPPITVNALGHLLTRGVTPAHQQDRAQATHRAATIQAVTGDRIKSDALKGLYFLAFAILMAHRFLQFFAFIL